MISEPPTEQDDDELFSYTTGSYLYNIDTLAETAVHESERVHCSLHDSSKLVRHLKYKNGKWAEYLRRTLREHHQSTYDQQVKL